MEKIRVIAFDDHKDLRETVRLLVDREPDMVCVAVHPDLSHIMRDIEASAPDVIIMDIQMPGLNGIEGVRAIRSKYPKARILMQTVFEDTDRIFDAISAGASGYILKNAKAEEILRAIRDVHDGGSPMTSSIASKVLDRFRVIEGNSQPSEEYNLSQRETEVLEHLVDGKSYKMIAAQLEISYHTVDSHIRKIYEKLHVSSMSEAVSKAIKKGLV